MIDSEMNCKTTQSLLFKAHCFKYDKYRESGGCEKEKVGDALKHLMVCDICKNWFVTDICKGTMIGRFEGDLAVPNVHSRAHDLLKTKCLRNSNHCPW